MSFATRVLAITLFSTFWLASGCATRGYVANKYSRSFKVQPSSQKQTVVVILVDGLSRQTLNSALASLKNVRRFFKTDDGIFEAHAGFPSLTFPGVSSLLKEAPVSQTGFIGNSFYLGNELENFELPAERKKFGKLMHGNNIFTRLAAAGARSISLDYGLGVDATVVSPIEDSATLVELALGNYEYVDAKKIDSLRIVLEESPRDQWPDFVFIHLVGLDFLSHEFGHEAASSKTYLSVLDTKLEALFTLLERAERDRTIVTLLTADHGFVKETKYYFPIETLLSAQFKKIRVVNESRMAAIFLESGSRSESVAEFLVEKKGIEIVGEKTESGFYLRAGKRKIEIKTRPTVSCGRDEFAISSAEGVWHCPSRFDLPGPSPSTYPFLISNLAHYFRAPNAPDIVVIPDPETTFSRSYRGNHGGPTTEETVVPLLLRNGRIETGEVPALWRLLDFVQPTKK